MVAGLMGWHLYCPCTEAVQVVRKTYALAGRRSGCETGLLASLRAAAWTSRVFTHVSTRCHAAEDLCGESCHQIRERFRIS